MRHSRSAVFAALALSVMIGGDLAAAPPAEIVVEAVYPGANAKTVADAVAAPIEQQVNGVEGMLRMWSRCGNDGSYKLTISFPRNANIDLMQVLVQNRVSLALPQLPAEVNRIGLTVKKKPAGILAIIPLLSPDGSRNTIYLSNYASLQLKDELARLSGVGDVRLVGQRDYALRVRLDPAKLLAHGLTAADVVKAIAGNNFLVEADKSGGQGNKGQSFQLLVRLSPRTLDAEKLGEIIVKAEKRGRFVRLKDVAQIELAAKGEDNFVSLDGKPAVALVVYVAQKVKPSKVSAALKERLKKLRERLPKGIDFGALFDFCANLEAGDKPKPAYLLADVALPDSASFQRVVKAVDRCASLLRQTRGVRHVLALAGDDPFDCAHGQARLLASLAPADKERGGKEGILKDARRRLQEVREARVWLRELSQGACPLEMLVSGPDRTRVKQLARKLSERLRRTTAVTDVRGSAEERRKGLFIDIDLDKARNLGVSASDIADALQTYSGVPLGEGSARGRVWHGRLPGNSAKEAQEIRQLKVRNQQGKMVPLGAIISLSVREWDSFVYRYDIHPAERITANPALGVSPTVARKVCDKAFEEVRKALKLSSAYRLSWLRPGD